MAVSRGARQRIFLVDDDEAIRDVLTAAFGADGFDPLAFADGADFLERAERETPACVLLDVMMPGLSGLDILKRLNQRHYAAPVFIVSGSGDIPMAVEAIRHGALDFIEKPFDPVKIVDRVVEALAASGARAEARMDGGSHLPVSDQLTPREREVLTLVAGGQSNKEAGRALGISPRTIEVHRARIMEKIGAKNAADLVRIVMSMSGERR